MTVLSMRFHRPTPRILFRGLCWVTAALMLCMLWPTRLGGATTVLVVQGNSMYPTLANGDLVLARSQDRYHSGQIVVFDVQFPGSSSRLRVMHRILAIAADGTVTTRGDNRATSDEFGTTTDDIIGEAVATVPRGGTVLWFMSRWWTLAAASGLITVMSLWKDERRQDGASTQPFCILTSL